MIFVSLAFVMRNSSINFNVSVKQPNSTLYIEGIGFVSLQRFTFRQSPLADRYPTEIFGNGSFFAYIIEETRLVPFLILPISPASSPRQSRPLKTSTLISNV